MKKPLILSLLIALSSTVIFAQVVNVNPDPNGEPWLVGGLRPLTVADKLKLANMKKVDIQESKLGKRAVLPARIDHSNSKYFPPVFNQTDGSCGQASGVGYTFNYEINAVRDLDASVPENQYPTHYTYNFLNEGSGANGSWYFDGWDIIRVNGCPNIIQYGGSRACLGDRGWMTGYDKYYAGMLNRVLMPVSISVDTPEGLEILKHWFNSRAEGSPVGGVVNFAAGATGYSMGTLPAGTHEAGKQVMTAWGTEVNHAMTFSGYDDSIRYDWNGDNQFTNDIDITGDGIVDMRDWEIGGVIVVNSWGSGWGNSGRAYMMYRLLAESVPRGGIMNNVVHGLYAKATYEPKLTLKASLKHTSREKLRITAGVSSDPNASVPDHVLDLPLFNQQGGDFSVLGGDSLVDETLEFGIDVSPLLNFVDSDERAIFYLIVDEIDPGNEDNGEIVSLSLIDHGLGGTETMLLGGNIAIQNNNSTFVPINKTVSFEPVSVTTETLPATAPGEYYSQQLEAMGGEDPYYWSAFLGYRENDSSDPFPHVFTEQLNPSNNDDGEVIKTLDFDFPFYGETYRDLVILTDGSIVFSGKFQYLRSVPDLRAQKAISVYASDLMIYPADGDGIWYEGDENSATFHWKTSKFDDQPAHIDVAVTLRPDGSLEFFYGPNISLGSDWVSGVSLGDEENITLTSVSSTYNLPDNKALSFDPPDFPFGMQVSRSGIFQGTVPDFNKEWLIRFKVVDNLGLVAFQDIPFSVRTLNADESILASEFKLLPNYPNPFNASTRIAFDLPEYSAVTLEVFNVRGQKIKTLVRDQLGAGHHSVSWDGASTSGTRAPSGIYYFRLSNGTEQSSQKMLLIK
ncbi:MAG: T9SS type A sorting domain-containing protein [Candidatus Marinimicrobia bacterium]|nr:T9SS type A sorting domain-containing protein [Candidatus Neomarinimicrobiota bacterium]MCF7904224.1 T9SS type A sorting domain-containing protein [Candidatus Neomarinimicrobiota bacterium]